MNSTDIDEASGPVDQKGWTLATVLAACFVAVLLIQLLQIPAVAGFQYIREPLFVALLGLALAYAFLAKPARRSTERSSIPWYDSALAIAVVGTCAVIAVSYKGVVDDFNPQAAFWNWPAAVLIVLLLECTRRVLGWPFVFVLVTFFLYALFGDLMPGRLRGMVDPFETYAAYLVFDKGALLVGWPAIPSIAWIVMLGQVIAHGGGRRWVADFINQWASSSTRCGGGPVVLFSAALGSISKDGAHLSLFVGPTAIPMMKDLGWSKVRAAGLVAAAGTGNYVLPTSIGSAAVVGAELVETSISEVILAALIPGLLFYFSLFLALPRIALRSAEPRQTRRRVQALLQQLIRGWHIVLALVLSPIVFFSSYASWLNLVVVHMVLLVFVIVTCCRIGYGGDRLTVKAVSTIMRRTMTIVLVMALLASAFGIVAMIMQRTGLSSIATLSLTDLTFGVGFIGTVVIVAIWSLLLGAVLPGIMIVLLMSTTNLVQFGLPAMSVVMFFLFLGMLSALTPPFGFAGVAASAVARTGPIRTCLQGMRAAWPAFLLPFAFLAWPGLVLVGSTFEIMWSVVMVFCGMAAVIMAVKGHYLAKLDWRPRILLGAASILILWPAFQLPVGLYANIVGLALCAAVTWIQYRSDDRANTDVPGARHSDNGANPG